MGRFVVGVSLGIVLVPVVVLLYFKAGRVPVAVSDPPFPQERLITSVPLNARIDREMVKNPPVQADETTFVAGAHTYSENCAVCHGFHNKPSKFGLRMFPTAPPLWEKHRHGDVVGVSIIRGGPQGSWICPRPVTSLEINAQTNNVIAACI